MSLLAISACRVPKWCVERSPNSFCQPELQSVVSDRFPASSPIQRSLVYYCLLAGWVIFSPFILKRCFLCLPQHRHWGVSLWPSERFWKMLWSCKLSVEAFSAPTRSPPGHLQVPRTQNKLYEPNLGNTNLLRGINESHLGNKKPVTGIVQPHLGITKTTEGLYVLFTKWIWRKIHVFHYTSENTYYWTEIFSDHKEFA